ncbi:hypothetical protein SAMN05444397_107144 [Flavobacterium aquidurense]|uniref:TraB family protein n=1 Tax=Flavobacterium frigidimaris TaxID=262320 RepID=A0ABX4BX59_FLAFR|nr:DUF5694 domain-containing protein [Flavobacterium frigidimaris]OXA82537.1 hypothetical protein B0A65_00620 [Flavobacterium frigidimaris]SDZ47220.1 hypothetical protein SAMN05444397_107144 [Flavobacterium aquidurense]
MTFIKAISTFLITLLVVTTSFGQAAKPKTKILLIGTIHFETPHLDSFELKTDDFLAPKRQQELEQLTETLKRTNADKVMIEKPFTQQKQIDSLYIAYSENRYKLTVSEREQIGFRLAKKLNLKQINCVDVLYLMTHDSLVAVTAKEKNQLYLLKDLGTNANKIIHEIDSVVKRNSITEVLKYINTKELLQKNLSIYLKYIAKVGAGENYIGAESVSDWYLRNLAIYANVMNQITANDKYVVLIFGQGHIPILKHLLQNNDDFEVVEVNSVLK